MLSFLRKSKIMGLGFIALALMLVSPNRSAAQERYPAVARISFVSGPVTYSRGDDPDQWDDAIENVPVTIGDRIYSPEGGRVELQLSSGNFVRLAPRSYFSTLNLSDDVKQFYLGEGVATFNIRRLPSNEVIEIDTPNVSVTLDEPGNYRISVDENGDSRVTARRGRVTVAASGRQIAVENSEMRIYGIDSPRYEIVGLPAVDAFDRWVSDRDTRFDRSYSNASRYASEDIIGVEDLSDYGRWEQIPEYGYAWTPASVAAGWVPFSAGRWFWQDPWGWSWISNDRWGWATSHYGRWTQYRSRWYWVPVRPRTRVIYAPAVVEFVRVRDHVGWFPLHPRDRYVPWWDRRDRFDRNITYVNRNYVTIVNQNTFISARPVNRYIVRDSVVVRDFRSARLENVDLPVPTRSSIRVISETGGRRGHRPPENILTRAAVVRTAPALPQPTFQDKLPRIQKARGKPIEPSEAATLTADAKAERVRVRPAAEVTRGSEFAARNPSATGPAPQPITEARGKKLARETAATQSTPADQNVGSAAKTETLRPEQERDRQRQARQQEQENRKLEQQKEQEVKAKQKQEQAQQRQQELKERQAQKQREVEQRQQQKEQERQSQAQKQKQAQERRQEAQPRASREQQSREELERQQAQREEQRKAQALQQQQEREQARQKQEQERNARQQQDLQRRQQEQDRNAQARQQQQEREQARQQQLQERQVRQQQDLQRQQQQQEQARREQARQQQIQERQAREQQLRQQQAQQREAQQAQQQQNLERQQQQQQQRQEQARGQQLRQQQGQQQREAQQLQRQQEQERRQQSKPQPQQEQQSRQQRLPQPDPS